MTRKRLHEAQEELMELKLETAKYSRALNKIGMLAKGEQAYTAEFTIKVEEIVRFALEIEDNFPGTGNNGKFT